MNNYLDTFLIIVIILLIVLIVQSYVKLQKTNLKHDEKIHEIFQYNFIQICQYQITPQYKTNQKQCDRNGQNGPGVAKCEWISNPNKDKYFCFFYNDGNYLALTDGKHQIANYNYWISVYDKINDTNVGSIRFSTIVHQNMSKVYGKAPNPFRSSKVSTASGVFEKLNNANILFDFRKDVRQIHVYTDQAYFNKEYEIYEKTQKKININYI